MLDKALNMPVIINSPWWSKLVNFIISPSSAFPHRSVGDQLWLLHPVQTDTDKMRIYPETEFNN